MLRNRIYAITLLCALLLCFCSQPLLAKTIAVLSYRFAAHDHKARFVLDLAKQPRYTVFELNHPDRLVLDIKNGKMQTNVQPFARTNTFAKDIRYALRKPHELRIVLDLKHAVQFNSFILPATAKQATRLVIDMHDKRLKPTTRRIKKQNLQRRRQKPHVVLSARTKQQHKRRVVVVIDPGHGGKDPGATGPGGIHEKNVVLAIAKDLQRDIDKQPGIIAKLTRKGDYYITLRDRLRIARRDKANIFVSIHADAFPSHKATGASVFALSLRGASSTMARWLADKENKSELLGGVQLSDKSTMLRSVLLDLSQTATIHASLQLGTDVLNELKDYTILHHKRVEQAAFVVLKSPDIPSILIETGFITNPKEERKLASKRYQQRLANAIMHGIRDYFFQKPPPGSWFARYDKHHHRNLSIHSR